MSKIRLKQNELRILRFLFDKRCHSQKIYISALAKLQNLYKVLKTTEKLFNCDVLAILFLFVLDVFGYGIGFD